ncbi:MAG: hypothetical protein E6J45_14235 [Chloroflexi bacterium]|nr:MAG: hypothetical protein E6J45_14235 [Chloroflexota bacterium]
MATAPSTPTTSHEARQQIVALERERATLPEQIRTARRAEARGERDATARRAQLELLAEELPAIIADLEAREAAFRERQQREREAARAALAPMRADLLAELDVVFRKAGAYRRGLLRVADVEAALSPLPDKVEVRRQLVHRESLGAHVETAGRVVAEFLGADPAVDLNLGLLDRLTGAEGDLKRRVRDNFFRKE